MGLTVCGGVQATTETMEVSTLSQRTVVTHEDDEQKMREWRKLDY